MQSAGNSGPLGSRSGGLGGSMFINLAFRLAEPLAASGSA